MSDMTNSQPRAMRRVVPMVALAAIAVVGAITLREHLDFEMLAAHRESLIAYRDSHYVGAALVFMAAYALLVAFSLPGATMATLAGGFLFGTFPGVAFNVIGATSGAIAIFLAARWGLGQRLAAGLDASEGTVHRIKRGIDDNQWEMLFLIRLVPVVPFFVANLVPALLDVPLRRFAISTLFGILPGALVYTSVGAGLGTVFAAGEMPNLGIIFEPHILLPLLGLCALAALPIVLKSLRNSKDT